MGSIEKDKATYFWAGVILKAGMYSSFVVMAIGLVGAMLSNTTAAPLDYRAVPLDRLVDALLAGDPDAVLSVGLLLLLASPGASLLSIVATFVAARNWRFAALAAVSAGILLLSVGIAMR